MSKKTKTAVAAPEFPCSVETYCRPDYYWRSKFTENFKEPSCFNCGVSIKRYRITFEEIHEPNEVLEQRLLWLWMQSDNHHDWNPLKAVASQLGVELDPSQFGINRKKP